VLFTIKDSNFVLLQMFRQEVESNPMLEVFSCLVLAICLRSPPQLIAVHFQTVQTW